MKKYRKRDGEIARAAQWFTLGDHPAVRVLPLDEQTSEKCQKCGQPMYEHGTLVYNGRRMPVHPGEWVVEGIAESYYTVDPKVFPEVFEEIPD